MQKRNAPGGIELDEDILRIVKHNLIELLPHKRENRLILTLRNRLTLQLRLQPPLHERLNMLLHPLRTKLSGLVERVLQLLADILDDEARPFRLDEVQCFGVVAEFDGVDPDEVQCGFVFGGDGLDGVDCGFFGLGDGGVEEDVGEGFGALRIRRVVLRIHFVDNRDRQIEQPRREFVGGGGFDGVWVGSLRVVEGAVEDDGRGSDALGFGSLGVGGETEQVVVPVFFGCGAEFGGGGVGGRGEVGDGDDFVGGFKFFEVGRGDVGDGGERLSVDE